MEKLMKTVLEWLTGGENVILATIIADSGSTPRGAGARMAVISDSSFTGTIGGGAIEYKAQQMALEALKDKKSLIKSFILSPNEKEDLGMVCGGNVTVYIQYISALDENARNLFAYGANLFSQNVDSWLVTDITDATDWRMTICTSDSQIGDSLPDDAREKGLFTNRGIQVEISGRVYYS
ncbi:MAG: XdhC family protein, partial [Synergistaceae bacterium]|nr:XdhC family protein [Synergistaceae bacterium]